MYGTIWICVCTKNIIYYVNKCSIYHRFIYSVNWKTRKRNVVQVIFSMNATTICFLLILILSFLHLSNLCLSCCIGAMYCSVREIERGADFTSKGAALTSCFNKIDGNPTAGIQLSGGPWIWACSVYVGVCEPKKELSSEQLRPRWEILSGQLLFDLFDRFEPCDIDYSLIQHFAQHRLCPRSPTSKNWNRNFYLSCSSFTIPKKHRCNTLVWLLRLLELRENWRQFRGSPRNYCSSSDNFPAA